MNSIVIYSLGASGGGWLYGWPNAQKYDGFELSIAMTSLSATSAR